MYKRYENGWLKYFDFLLLDMLALQLAFVISSFIRFGFISPYASVYYQKISLLLIIINCCVAFFDESYQNIIERGYLKELRAGVKHVALIFALMLLYLYLTKQNAEMSRIFFVYLTAISLLLIWLFRCGRKSYLHSRRERQPEKTVSNARFSKQ